MPDLIIERILVDVSEITANPLKLAYPMFHPLMPDEKIEVPTIKSVTVSMFFRQADRTGRKSKDCLTHLKTNDLGEVHVRLGVYEAPAILAC